MHSKIFLLAIPKPVIEIAKELVKNNHAAYLVGGGLRDLLLGFPVKDWDIATSAKPLEITKAFPDSFYNNKFGTVGVKVDLDSAKSNVVEITTFRKESQYSDARHPDKIIFAKSVTEDLKRRDFTVNALALNLRAYLDVKTRKILEEFLKRVSRSEEIISFEKTIIPGNDNLGPGIQGEKDVLVWIKEMPFLGFGKYPDYPVPRVEIPTKVAESLKDIIIDNFSGLEDLSGNLIRAVGDPRKRFQEDALRLIRAVRFSVELGFKIEKKTAEAIKQNSQLLGRISKERIRDEFSRIILSNWPAEGVAMLHQLGLLREVVPTLTEGVGVGQNWHHIYPVFEHALLALKFCFSEELEIRLAALLHDVAKPRVKGVGKTGQATFYNHEVVGERITRQTLSRLCFSSTVVDETSQLVRYHMFNYDPALHNESTVRRLLHRVGGIGRMKKLLILRIADRLGSGCKKGEVYKLRKLKYLIDKVSRDPISLKQLKVNGKDIMAKLNIKPSPQIGWLLEIMLAEIIRNPKENQEARLLKLAETLWLMEKQKPGTLATRQAKAKEFLEGKIREEDIEIQEKYRVREK
ncbi:MAG: HD domain-containing protein [Candidatus Moraniibacteriota bacterium]